jgi:predicted ArsR family transcriptional regulator
MSLTDPELRWCAQTAEIGDRPGDGGGDVHGRLLAVGAQAATVRRRGGRRQLLQTSTRNRSLAAISPTTIRFISLLVKVVLFWKAKGGCTNDDWRYCGGMDSDLTPPSSPPPSAAGLETVTVLADEVRRRLYGFLRRAHRPVTREEAAADAGISVKLAAFHLDKLVAAGLLRSRYESPDGTPRVGRKPKIYEPADTDIRISIPERRPDVLAEILVDALLSQEPGEDAQLAALRAARRRGEDLGAVTRARSRPGRLGPERSIALVEAELEQHGFEPDRQAPTELRLLNCPFHPLAARSPELVCGINHAFVGGFLTGVQAAGIDAVLAPHPGRCCVELRAAKGGRSARRPAVDAAGKEPGAMPPLDPDSTP